jgi:hypothetical protein
MSDLKVMVVVGMGVGVGVGVAVFVTLTVAFVGTGVGATVVGTGVGTSVVGAAVGVTGLAGCEVHPQIRIPTNRIIRTTSNFFMHVFFVISVYKHIQFSSNIQRHLGN